MQFVLLSAVLIALAVLSGTSAYNASTDLTYQLYTQSANNTPYDLYVPKANFNKDLLTQLAKAKEPLRLWVGAAG